MGVDRKKERGSAHCQAKFNEIDAYADGSGVRLIFFRFLAVVTAAVAAIFV